MNSLLPKNRRRFGQKQETLAAEYLRKQGLKLLQSNYHCRAGEIDLIMIDTLSQLVFIEVRYRSQNTFGCALSSVTAAKQRKVRLSAAQFLASKANLSHLSCRFDVMGISPEITGDKVKFEWIKNAFY